MDTPPSVTMLWESTDPHDALATRFGFSSPAAASTWVAETLDATWGLAVERCDRLVISSWNALAWVTAGERRLIAKWCAAPKAFPRLRDAAAVTTWLHEHNIPVAAPRAAVDGDLLVEISNDARTRSRGEPALADSRFLVGVLPVVDGALLDTDVEAQVIQAGQMLAAVHDALAAYPAPVAGRRPNGDDQLVHNDFRSANLLHDGTSITAVLDLEDITFDTRIADLAKASVMLATRYRDWAPTSAEVRASFINSYSSNFALTSAARRQLDARISAVLEAERWL